MSVKPSRGRVVVASNNPGKLRELSTMLAALGVEAVAQGSLGVPEAGEPHDTFVENALAKARNAARHTGLAALADDSGLCVEALGGAPGVRSAHYAGLAGTREERDARNNALLVDSLRAKATRRAHYYCVIVLLRHAGDPEPLIAEGRWHGEIALAPRGANGFGYDPWFLVPGRDLTAAELDTQEKNRVSHRAIALQRLNALMESAPS